MPSNDVVNWEILWQWYVLMLSIHVFYVSSSFWVITGNICCWCMLGFVIFAVKAVCSFLRIASYWRPVDVPLCLRLLSLCWNWFTRSVASTWFWLALGCCSCDRRVVIELCNRVVQTQDQWTVYTSDQCLVWRVPSATRGLEWTACRLKLWTRL